MDATTTTTTTSSEDTAARDVYRVAVVGDEGVGKTSLVSTLVHTVPPDTLPAVLAPAALPPLDAPADGLPGVCVVVDTPAPRTAAQRAAVAAAVRAAHCVVVVVDALRPATLARVFDFWEGFVARARAGGADTAGADTASAAAGAGETEAGAGAEVMGPRTAPLVVALNKADLRGPADAAGAQMLAVLREAVESCRVESAFTCCAHARQSVVDMFRAARQLIFFPVTPLLTTSARDADFGASVSVDGGDATAAALDAAVGARTESLTAPCRAALARVFCLLDRDNDGVLNTRELATLARLMFASGGDSSDDGDDESSSGSESDGSARLADLERMVVEMHLAAGDVSVVQGNDLGAGDPPTGLSPIRTPLRASRPGALAPGPRPTPGTRVAVTPDDDDDYYNAATAAAAAAAVRTATPQRVTYVDVPPFTLDELEALVLAYAAECPELFWKVLYHYGYDTALQLTAALLAPPLAPAPPGCRYELSAAALGFLAERFHAHDRAGAGVLGAAELARLFAPVPDGQPFPCAAPMTLAGFLEHFRMLCLVDARALLRTVACLGFPGAPADAVELHGNSSSSSAAHCCGGPPRTVFHAFVFGSRGCGKTALLRGLAGLPFVPGARAVQQQAGPEQWACGTVPGALPGGGPAHLVLTEFADDDAVVHDRAQMQRCDVCCLVFDTHAPSSFAHALRLHELVLARYPALPCVHVAAKTDLAAVRQVAHVSPHAFLAAHALPQPVAVSMRSPNAAAAAPRGVYAELVRAACEPARYVPRGAAVAPAQPPRALVRRAVLGCTLAVSVGALAALALRMLFPRSSGSSRVSRARPASHYLFAWRRPSQP